MDRLFNTFKENYQMVITIGTAVLTILYGFICCCIYIYNKGYFTAINMEPNLMKVNYIEYIYYLIFTLFYFIFFYFTADWYYSIFSNNDNFLKKLIGSFFILFITLLIFIYSFDCLIHHKLELKRLISQSTFIYISIEFILLFIIYTNRKKPFKKQTLEYLLIAIILVSPCITSTVYDQGYDSFKNKSLFTTTLANDYVVMYCNGDQYILCPYELKNNILIIDTNKHKVVSVENINTKTIHPDSVELKS